MFMYNVKHHRGPAILLNTFCKIKKKKFSETKTYTGNYLT